MINKLRLYTFTRIYSVNFITNFFKNFNPRSELSTLAQKTNYAKPPYPRSNKFKIPTENDLRKLKSLLNDPTNQFFDSIEDIIPYCSDWTGVFQSSTIENTSDPLSRTPVVIFPQTVKEISNILKYCNDNKIALSPQAGNTGLVWGSVPLYDEIVINLSKLNSIISFDNKTGTLKCEAGCIVENLNNFLNSQSPPFMLPYDLGSKGSCQIGGNISTNAGGLRMVRYGNLAGSVLGLEIVLADGTVIDSTSELKKDNTGIKLHQLFLGAEGTLGIVTKVIIQCPNSPSSVQTCLLKFDSFEKLNNVALQLKEKFSDIIAALEFFDNVCLTSVLKVIPNTKDAFNRDSNSAMEQKLENVNSTANQFYLLIETHGQNELADKTRVSQVVESLVENGTINDGLWVESETQRKEIWVLREQISTSLNYHGKVHKFDLTFKPGNMYAVIEECRQYLADYEPQDLFTVGYGHVGDGNIHLNVIVKNTKIFEDVGKRLDEWVYKYTIEQGGSISAEHGIGSLKSKKLSYAKDISYINTMRILKNLFDPYGILNPYKLIPK